MSLPIPVPTRTSLPVPVPQGGGTGFLTRDSTESSFENEAPKFFDLVIALAPQAPQVLSALQEVRPLGLRRLRIEPIEMCLLVTMIGIAKRGDKIPSWDVLRALVETQVRALDEAMVELIPEVFGRIEALRLDPKNDAALVIRFTGWVRRELEVLPAAAQTMQDVSSGRITLEQGTSQLVQLRGKENAIRTPSNPLSYADAFDGDVMSTGMPWFDEVLGGKIGPQGFCRGSGYSCIATTGGGKTTFAYQLAFSMARLHKRVLLFSTEQTFQERMVVSRMWSSATGLPFAKFAALTGKDEPPDELVSRELKQQVYEWMSYIDPYDFAKQPGTLEEIDNLAAHHKPDLIILDWAGTLAGQLVDVGKFEERHSAVAATADFMREAATRHGCATYTLHQIAGAKGKNPFGEYSHNDAQDCKTFSYNMAGALVMTPPDDKKVFRIHMSKSRYCVNGSQYVRIDPNVARIVPIEGTVRKGKGGLWTTGDSATIPDSTRPKSRSDGGFGGA